MNTNPKSVRQDNQNVIQGRKQFNARTFINIAAALLGLSLNTAYADRDFSISYEVTLTNIAHGQFAAEGDRCRTGPMMGLFAFATHRPDFKLFELGKEASGELANLSENGTPFLLVEALSANPKVEHAFSVPAAQDFPARLYDGVLCPGREIKTTIQAKPGNRFTMAAMLFPSNDGFVALNGVELPQDKFPRTYFSQVYDAGSETNDELCNHMPGLPELPGCPAAEPDANSDPNIPDPNTAGGPGIGEGFINIHSGIHGIGDLKANEFDCRANVIQVTVRRISNY